MSDDLKDKPAVPAKPERKKLAELSATEKKALILEALGHEGYSPYQAAQLLGVSKQLTYRIDKQIRQGILAPLIYKARRSIGMLAEGKPVGEMEKVTGGDVIAAAKMIVDRYEPIVQKVEQRSFRAEITMTVEERQKYLQMLGMAPQITNTAGENPIKALTVIHEHEEEK